MLLAPANEWVRMHFYCVHVQLWGRSFCLIIILISIPCTCLSVCLSSWRSYKESGTYKSVQQEKSMSTEMISARSCSPQLLASKVVLVWMFNHIWLKLLCSYRELELQKGKLNLNIWIIRINLMRTFWQVLKKLSSYFYRVSTEITMQLCYTRVVFLSPPIRVTVRQL